MSGRRITIGNGTCAQAVGAAAVLAAIRVAAAPDDAVVAVGCDGGCWAQPVLTITDPGQSSQRHEQVEPEQVVAILSGVVPSVQPPTGEQRRTLARCGVAGLDAMDTFRSPAAYAGYAAARSLDPDAVVALVKEAGLRGRGGAYFPIALKWESARRFPTPRYLVVNAEEGEPGAYKDRHLMEGDPHLLLEGIAIAAHAIDCEDVYLYINGQAQMSAAHVGTALAQIEAARADGASWTVQMPRIHLYRGAGGYVCGEESVILNSIEGFKAVPRPRPPLPTEAGLFARPTVISNVETLCSLPAILQHGAAWFREVGTAEYPGTKLVSVSGAVQRPGLYEVPMGVTPRALLDLAGGVPDGRSLQAVVMGGPSGGFLSPDLLDVPLAGGLAHPTGAVLGSGGIVALDQSVSLMAAVRHLAAYNARESCGKCTPCREGNERALAIFDRVEDVAALSDADQAELTALCDVLQFASLCGLGQMSPGPLRSALALFGSRSL